MKKEKMIQQILYSGIPGHWEIIDGVLPNGTELNPKTGELICIPEEFGRFPVTVKFTNRCGKAIKDIIVVVRKRGSFNSSFNKSFN